MNVLNHHTRVAVLRGGPSEEYDISLLTGKGILTALEQVPCVVEDIVISRKGEWLKHGMVMEPQHALATTDVVFIALHGAYGEDGTVQRLLDRLAIPYTGSKPYGSSLAMNKLLAKEHLKNTGIKTAPHFRVSHESYTDLSRVVSTIAELFGPEYVVKPISGGSSIGMKMANSPRSLYEALEAVLTTHHDVLVEQRINGREATAGVVENFRNQPVYRLPAVEIVPPAGVGYFAAEVKYTGETEEICPGRFSRAQKQQLEAAADTVHRVLGLSQYSRSDFIVSGDDIYFLEVNTLPGMTAESLLPKSLQAVGCAYSDFIVHLLNDSLTARARS